MANRYVKAKKVARNPMRFTVVNKRMLEIEGCVGQCWPGTGDHVLEVDFRQCPKDYMDTVIHEALHELWPKERESKILKAGTSIANLLWQLGYRRRRKHKKRRKKLVP